MMIYYYSITGDDSTAIQFIALPFMVFMIACLLKHYKNCETLATSCKYAISNTVVDSITDLMLHLFVTRSST